MEYVCRALLGHMAVQEFIWGCFYLCPLNSNIISYIMTIIICTAIFLKKDLFCFCTHFYLLLIHRTICVIFDCFPPEKTWHKVSFIVVFREGEIKHKMKLKPSWTYANHWITKWILSQMSCLLDLDSLNILRESDTYVLSFLN